MVIFEEVDWMVAVSVVGVGVEDVSKGDTIGFVEASFQNMKALANLVAKFGFELAQTIVAMV
jgi:hypothetical protein